MTINNDQFNKLNEIALVLVRKVDTKTYEEMCEILSEVYKTDIAESEECAKDVSVDSLSRGTGYKCAIPGCTCCF